MAGVVSGDLFNKEQDDDRPDTKGESERELLSGILYRERYRPQYHYSPSINWLNDPNGLVYYQGEYHLFYQYNNKGNTWGYMSWGHAISTDMVHWEVLPLAIPETEDVWIFSGSAVVDVFNTSGLGYDNQPAMVAIYTGYNRKTEIQDQRLAFSLDNGRTWVKYNENPVLDIKERNFRDPKVFWYQPDSAWRMVVVLSQKKKVLFYRSYDLKKWQPVGEFGPAGADTLGWECPDMFPLPVEGDEGATKWVLVVSVESGGPSGLHGIEYFIGDFDGSSFVSELHPWDVRWEDYGRDFYAAQSYSCIPPSDGRRIMIGWINAPKYAGKMPTFPWRGSQSIPREISLAREPDGELSLKQTPVREVASLREKTWSYSQVSIGQLQDILAQANLRGQTREIQVTFLVTPDSREFGLGVLKGDQEETIIGYSPAREELFVDVSHSGDTKFDPLFSGVRRAPLGIKNGRIILDILVDWSSVEVFANNGSIVMTNRVFPSPSSCDIVVYGAFDMIVETFTVYALHSIWHKDIY